MDFNARLTSTSPSPLQHRRSRPVRRLKTGPQSGAMQIQRLLLETPMEISIGYQTRGALSSE